MSRTMKAVLFHAPRDLRLAELPMPEPGPGEILLKVGAALTCGTDFKAYRQGHKVLLGDLPARFGHELAGTVVSAGRGVAHFKPGDRVVAANSAPCDGCYYCDRGQNQLCDRLCLHNGAYAEYDLIPAHIVARNAYAIGDLPFETAALAEPLACAVHGVETVRVGAGETVAVLGAGPMSWLLIQALRARGARVLVVGRGAENLSLARRAGAHETVSVLDGDPVERVRALTAGRGADAVFEAVGRTETWQQSVAMARKGGKVCLFGGCAPATLVPIDAHRVHYGQLSLFGVFHHTPRYFKAALDLLAAGKVQADLLVSGRIGLSEVPAYFERMQDRSRPKVAVLP